MKGLILVLLLAVALTSALNLRDDAKAPGPSPRITNGLTAKTGQFNFQVGLSMRLSLFTGAWCGGSLISPEWIVTAAHCTDGIPISKITAYLGSTRQQAGTKAKILEKIVHSEWNQATVINDISLLRIEPVTLGPTMNIVNLPPLSKVYPKFLNEKVIASGWGMINDEGDSPIELQYATMKIVPNSVCFRSYGSAVKSSNICALGPVGTSSCSGDSGGPLVTENTRTLVGITSFGAEMGCTLGFPEAFTRVTSYRSWILEQTGI